MSNQSRQSAKVTPPARWAPLRIAQELHCGQCQYDVRGLRADGQCPECGCNVWTTIQSTVDPTASRMPQLHNPRGVGNALVTVSAGILLSGILFVLPLVIDRLDSLNSIRIRFPAYIPTLHWYIGVPLLFVGLWAAWVLTPPRMSDLRGPVLNDIWKVAVGWIGWLAGGCVWVMVRESAPDNLLREQLMLHFVVTVAGTLGLLGLRDVFRIVGIRSRDYRHSRGGRQSLTLIIGAVSAGLIAHIVKFVSQEYLGRSDVGDTLDVISTIVLWATTFMALIGFLYLTIDAVLIRRALVQPPPKLADLLGDPSRVSDESASSST